MALTPEQQAAVDARREELRFPQAWSAEKEGDALIGRVTKLTRGTRKNKRTGETTDARILYVDTGETGNPDDIRSLWESATLGQQFDDLIADGRLREDARIICVYDGEKKTSRGNRCKLYTLAVL